MGFGSNPNLQSLDQLQTRLPQREQLTWQQQLLAQQQHQSPCDSFGFQNQQAGGLQNHHSHHLPAVPMWQNPTTSFQQNPAAALGHIGHPASPSLLPQPLQGPYPMQLDPLGLGEIVDIFEQQHTALSCTYSHVTLLTCVPCVCSFIFFLSCCLSYIRLSIRLSICLSIRLSLRLSVRPSIHYLVVHVESFPLRPTGLVLMMQDKA